MIWFKRASEKVDEIVRDEVDRPRAIAELADAAWDRMYPWNLLDTVAYVVIEGHILTVRWMQPDVWNWVIRDPDVPAAAGVSRTALAAFAAVERTAKAVTT